MQLSKNTSPTSTAVTVRMQSFWKTLMKTMGLSPVMGWATVALVLAGGIFVAYEGRPHWVGLVLTGLIVVLAYLLEITIAGSHFTLDGGQLTYKLAGSFKPTKVVCTTAQPGRVYRFVLAQPLASARRSESRLGPTWMQAWVDGTGAWKATLPERYWDVAQLDDLRARVGIPIETIAEPLSVADVAERFPGSLPRLTVALLKDRSSKRPNPQ